MPEVCPECASSSTLRLFMAPVGRASQSCTLVTAGLMEKYDTVLLYMYDTRWYVNYIYYDFFCVFTHTCAKLRALRVIVQILVKFDNSERLQPKQADDLSHF